MGKRHSAKTKGKTKNVNSDAKITHTEIADTEATNTETTNTDNTNALTQASIEGVTEVKAKRRKGKWIALAFVLIFLILTAGAYGGIGIYYQTHFLPNTIVGGFDCSGMEVGQAAEFWDESLQNYVLEVTGREPSTGESGAVLGTVVPEEVQMRYPDMTGTLEDIMSHQDWLLWIKSLTGQEYVTDVERQCYIYDEELVENLIKSWSACQAQNMLVAQDAYIGEYSEALRGYEVIPESQGTELDVEQAIVLVEETLSRGERSLDLESEGLYAMAKILQDDASLTEPVETANRWLSTSIAYDWNGNEVLLDADTIQEWVSIQDGEAILDEDAVTSFVKDQARNFDTYGKTKDFMTTLGVKLSLTSASYGWRTDRETEAAELLQLIQEGSTEPREPVYTHKGMVKVADSVNDVGDSYVEADLTNQHLYLYEDGEVVLETDFVSGRISNGNGTPAGIFGITYKTTNAVLRGRDYATPVNYWMPFYGNYGMHDATWRSSFGGDIFVNNGSHGCINLPKSMAEQIYAYVSTGFPVICYYYETPVAQAQSEELPDPETEAPEVGSEAEVAANSGEITPETPSGEEATNPNPVEGTSEVSSWEGVSSDQPIPESSPEQ